MSLPFSATYNTIQRNLVQFAEMCRHINHESTVGEEFIVT